MFSCTFSSKTVLSRAQTKDIQFTINFPVIYAYRLRFCSTVAYPNLAYSASNHVQTIFILSGEGKRFILEKKSKVIGRKSSYSYQRDRFIFTQLL
jgi:hypothetical protein